MKQIYLLLDVNSNFSKTERIRKKDINMYWNQKKMQNTLYNIWEATWAILQHVY